MSVFILENVSKSFKVDKTENQVLKDINIVFPDKGLISIVGKSGSGKSTLLNILMGIEKPTSGKVYFCSKDISKFSDKKFSSYHLSGASLIFQHYNLFNDFSAFDNVAIPLRMKGSRKNAIKKKVRDTFAKLSITNLLNRKVGNLSGGEKQRVAIARSIVTNPKVLLCDEPTGALDQKNGIAVMQILKQISKDMLVIMVSHNAKLVNEFSDDIVTLKDGKIEHNLRDLSYSKTNDLKRVKSTYKGKWILPFLRKNVRKNIAKNIFSVISCAIGFASIFVCVGFSVGSEKSQDEALTRNLSIGYATVSKIESYDIQDSPLSYQKTTRPDIEEVDEYFGDFKTIRCEENISYMISNYPNCVFEDKTLNKFEMIPVYDLSLSKYGSDLLIEGSGGSNEFNEIIINEEFKNLLGDDVIGKNVILKNTAHTSYNTGDEENPFIKDTLILEQEFTIVGVVKEFPFLNNPKIYYSYQGGKNFLKNQTMENLSFYKGQRYSFFNYIEDCSSDNEACSYSSYLFLDDLSECDQFLRRIKELSNTDLEVTSTVFAIKDTYTTFISSFSKTLILFVGIAFLGINFIMGMFSLSNYMENRKETAIMTCLGSRNSSIYKLYLFHNYILVGISFIISMFFANFLQRFLNPIVSKKFALSNLIAIPFEHYFGIPYGLIILMSIVAIIFSAIFTIIPMVIYRHGFIAEELRDE